MQPTLLTATYSAGRAAEAPQSLRPVGRIRIPRKAVAGALTALALGSAVVPATDAPGSTGTDPGSAGAAQKLVTGTAIVSPGQFGWQAHCPHTGPAPR
jgi:hypothetical protein